LTKSAAKMTIDANVLVLTQIGQNHRIVSKIILCLERCPKLMRFQDAGKSAHIIKGNGS
jgi:hypothetical protein